MEANYVYEYQVTQYDPQTGTGGLFVQYIDTFLKLKAGLVGTQVGFEVPRMRTATLANSPLARVSDWIKTL